MNNQTLTKVVESIERIATGSQQELRAMMKQIIYDKRPAACSRRCDSVAELEREGLVVRVDDPFLALSFLKRNELVARLDGIGAAGFKKNAKQADLVAWCVDTLGGDVLKLVPDVAVAVMSERLESVKKKSYIYLTRKFETVPYYDPDRDEIVDIPQGSEFVSAVTMAGSSLSLRFPDDEITALLDAHGCNRCRSWKR